MSEKWQQRPVQRVRTTSTDPDQASESFRRSFPGIELRSIGGGAAFAFAYEQASDGRMAVSRLRLTGSGVGDGSIGEGVAVGRVRGGHFQLDYGGKRIDTSLPFLRPAGRSSARMRDAHLQLIGLDPRSFTAAAYARLDGTGQAVRLPSIEATGLTVSALIPSWQGAVDHVVSVAFDEPAFSSPLIRAGLFDLLVSGLLASFPITSEVGASGRSGTESAAIRRALAFIDEHLAEPIDVTAIAEVARLPVRTLQFAFRSRIGMTPMQQVRSRRLAAARAELIDADPTTGASVAAVARRWGFAHMARFAGQYRRVYGENPSDTLRQ